MTYHKFCQNCKRILTLAEMENNLCSECIKEQIKAMQDKKEETNDTN